MNGGVQDSTKLTVFRRISSGHSRSGSSGSAGSVASLHSDGENGSLKVDTNNVSLTDYKKKNRPSSFAV